MKRNILIVLTVIIVAGILYYVTSEKGALPSNDAKVAGKQTSSAEPKKEITKFDATIDPLSVKNLEGSLNWFRDSALSQRFLAIDFTHISAIDVDGERYYFGFIESKFGDGTLDLSPSPAFIAKGKLYVSQGHSGFTYPMKETNWISRYKEYSLSGFAPLEKPIYWDTEAAQMSMLESGIDNIVLKADKEGTITGITFSMGEKIIDSSGPFLKVAPFNLASMPQFAGEPSYVNYQETWRKLPGNVGKETEFVMDTGYRLTYPSLINGFPVTILNDSPHNYYFSAGDEPTHTDYVTLWCNQGSQEQIGPRTAKLPPFFDAKVEERISDWGYQKRYHADAYSFTAPGFYCQIHTSGIFRPEMFQIAF